MYGNEVRAVFEAAANYELTLTFWHRYAEPNGRERLGIRGTVNASGRTFSMLSAPFGRGQIAQTAAVLGKIAWLQQGAHGVSMAAIELKIKGLTEVVATARKGIVSAREAVSGVGTAATELTQFAAQVEQQIKAAHADLEFEATNLGNAGAESSQQSGT